MNEPLKNYGLNLELERAHQDGTEWKFGALSQPCLAEIPQEERIPYLPKGEVQFTTRDDMMDCATRAPINILETKFTYLYQTNKLSAINRKWLEDNGYVEDGRAVFSDAFVAINSGTTRQGNSLKAPVDAIRKQGIIPKELLPLLPTMTWEEYHDPKRITQAFRDLGAEFARRFTINYEQVFDLHFADVLYNDTISVAGYAWTKPVNGEYPKSDNPPNHAFMAFKTPKYFIFDNYVDPVDGDFIKKLAPDYRFLEYGYRIFISRENTEAKKVSWWEIVASFLKKLFSKPQ